MKINAIFFIGIDFSKLTFDAAILVVNNHEKQDIKTKKFNNSAVGLKEFHKWLKSLKVTFDEKTLLVIENTGIYHRMLWAFCSENNLPIHIGNAARIKWSFSSTSARIILTPKNWRNIEMAIAINPRKKLPKH